jgi:glycosyltransferase involved in cell wall biosynthesis
VRQANQGPGAARNCGLKESAAPLVTFLDADDEWMPTYLEKTVRVLNDHPSCDAVAAACIFARGERGVSHFQQLGVTEGPWSVDSCHSARELTSVMYIAHSMTTMCRRDVVRKYGGFYEKDHCTYGEDRYLWLQVLFGHKIYLLVEALGWYRQEASELAVGLKTRRPLEPVFTDPEPIRRHCPAQRRALLERCLAQYALATAHELAGLGDVARAAWLVEAFPLMKRRRWEYLKLRIKLAAPSLVPRVRDVKSRFGAARKAS